MRSVTFTVPGKPIAKGRPRFGNGRAFTPQTTVTAEAVIKLAAMEHFAEPISGPVRVSVTAYFSLPQSWPKTRRATLIGRPHTQRPDADNIVKTVTDALNGVAYDDDGQISELRVRKLWAEHAETVVLVQEAGL